MNGSLTISADSSDTRCLQKLQAGNVHKVIFPGNMKSEVLFVDTVTVGI